MPRIANADRTFPLYDLLLQIKPDLTLPDVTAYAASRNPNIDTDALTHFALGVFWKASVHHWHGNKTEPQINLGPYEARLRSFVHAPKATAFPDHISLAICVLPPASAPNLANVPIRGLKSRLSHSYRFYIPGIQFVLIVGKDVDAETCFARNPLHPILVKDVSAQVESGPRSLIAKSKQKRILPNT